MDNTLSGIQDADRSLFPGSFTIRALRDSRYNNTAYAIAELIDNSIEAKASRIDLICKEENLRIGSRTGRQVTEIAILDDGRGMDALKLLHALKFGGGTNHNAIRGIGKYGMGLPTSSMSQCKRVDVWTWQDGPNSVLHSYIDAVEIEDGKHEVPMPDGKTPIPNVWRRPDTDGVYEGNSGTLVVWSNLDKIQWKKAHTIIRHTSREVGRIHRHFIQDLSLRIRASSFLENAFELEPDFEIFKPNDPLYLMEGTSVPEPWDQKPMFECWPKREYIYEAEGKEERIVVRYSIVKPDAPITESTTQNPGSTPRGHHARHNIGVSVIRAGREIVLEDAFLREGGSADNPQNRWWGCEVEFQRGCDELFGVDHNKQMVANFSQAARMLGRDDRTNERIIEEEGLEDDLIYEIVGDIRDQVRAMMNAIKGMFERKRSLGNIKGKETPTSKAVRTASQADTEALRTGKERPSQTDRDRQNIPRSEREAGLTEMFEDFGHTPQVAAQEARRLVQEGIFYQFNPLQLDGFQMFSVRSEQGVLQINLNTDHPIYDLLKHIEGNFEMDIQEEDPAFQASVAIRLLLSSWARMEDQKALKEEKMEIQELARDWGKQAYGVLKQLRESGG